MVIPLAVMVFMAKEPPDAEHQSLRDHLACLVQADGWSFNLLYVITFGGFIGLATFLPTFYFNEFGVTKVQAAQLTMLATVMGSVIRAVGGYAADRVGGIAALCVVLMAVIGTFLALSVAPPLIITTALFMLCFAALGAGNGALFQMVPLRWPANAAVASSMIGEIGALGGAILPNAMGFSKQYTGGFAVGFLGYALFTAIVLGGLFMWQKRWTRTWVGPWGRALGTAPETQAIAAE
jgi:NNP family nitrate/nitrite transporter-like MFS transporter